MLPDEQTLRADLVHLLESEWGHVGATLTTLDGGMNSWTALVETADGLAVAKCVAPDLVAELERGADVSARLATSGVVTGAPYATTTGKKVVCRPWGAVVVMEHVVGRELTDSPADQQRMAAVLAQIHSVGATRKRDSFMDDIGSDTRLAAYGDWILPKVRDARERFRALPDTVWGTINSDPSLDSFLLDERTGSVGVIDWAGGGPGPVLYDIASAVMYLGGIDHSRTFLSAYAEVGPMDVHEISSQLGVFQRLRAAVQADYFARRIDSGDLTGISDEQENHQGLQDARSLFRELE